VESPKKEAGTCRGGKSQGKGTVHARSDGLFPGRAILLMDILLLDRILDRRREVRRGRKAMAA